MLRAIVLVIGLVTAGLVVAPSDASYTSSSSPTAAFASTAAYSYSAAVTASTPWAQWRFDETSGTTVSDSSGNARTLTLSATGTTRGIDGALLRDSSAAAAFDGISGCGVSSTTHSNPNPMTIEVWLRTTTRNGGLIVGFEGTTARATGVYGYDRQLFLRTDGRLALGTSPGASNTMTSPGAYNDGRWHLIHVTISAGANLMYVDGIQVSSGTGGASGTTNSWHVGCGTVHNGFVNAPTSGYLAAEIDEVAIYASALSSPTIAARWAAAPARVPYTAAVMASLPWASWQLGQGSSGSMPDSSGNGRNGTSSSSGLAGYQNAPARGGAGTAFDGVAGCTVSQATQANPQTFSVEGWLKTTTATGGAVVQFNDRSAADATGTTSRDRHVYMDASGRLYFGVFDGVTRHTVDSGTAAYNDGSWHHVVATLSSAGQRLYVDGALVGSGANTAAQNFTGYWHLGCGPVNNTWPSYPSTDFWTGSLDDWSIYTYALDAPTVASHFAAGAGGLSYTDAVAASAPAIWWRLGSTPSLEVPDSSGNSRRGVASNGGIRWGTNGVVPGDPAATFDGSTGCISATATMANPTPSSVEAWFRTTSTTGGWIVGFSSAPAPDLVNAAQHDRNVYLRDDGRVVYGTWTGSASTVTSAAAYNDGRWHHVVGTNGSSGTKLYVDGLLVGSNAATSAQATTQSWHVGCGYLGASWPSLPSSMYFQGDIDEVAIYTTELSTVSVQSHWLAAGMARPATAARFQSAPWAMWHLDEQSGTSLADATGNARGATASASGVTYGAAGVSGDDTALTFDGTSGCAVGSTVTSNMNPFSVEAWFRTTTTTGGPIFQYSTESGAIPPTAGFDRHVYMENSGRLRFGVFPGSAQTITTTQPYNDGAWHQVVGTLGPAGLAFYIDGGQVGTLPAVTTGGGYTAYWHLGCGNLSTWPSPPTSSYFAGSIDEVTVFTTQLDASTVSYRYALVTRRAMSSAGVASAPTPAIWWKLDETSGTAQDSSGNGVTGSAPSSGLTRGAAGAVPAGTAWALDGTSTPCMSSSATYANPSPFTVELWFRTASTSGAGLISFTSSADPAVSSNYDRHVYVRDSGVISFGVNPGSINVVTSSAAYNDGRWHHVAATLGTAGQLLYVDGSLVASGAATSAENFTGSWKVGCGKYSIWPGDPSNDYLNGAVDEFVYTQRQLSAAAIRTRYLAGITQHSATLSGSSTVATIMGTGTASSTGDGGSMSSATLNQPTAIATDPAGNIYVAEYSGCRIRRIAANGVVSTFAGTGTCSNTGDGGAATAATISNVEGLAVGPDGSVYIVITSANRVRKVSAAGIITTFAGTGTYSSTGDGGAATSATLKWPVGIAVDASSNVYVSEFDGHRVRKINSSGTISTVLGTGTGSFSGDGGAGTSATIDGPLGLAVGADGSLYVADYWNCRVRRLSTAGTVTTVAGNGSCTTSGNGGSATSAAIHNVSSVAIDPVGGMYIASEGANRVRAVTPAGIISTVLGTGTASSTGDGGAGSSATVNAPHSVALDATGRLLVSDLGGHRVRRLG